LTEFPMKGKWRCLLRQRHGASNEGGCRKTPISLSEIGFSTVSTALCHHSIFVIINARFSKIPLWWPAW
jgi:hypothetical protein